MDSFTQRKPSIKELGEIRRKTVTVSKHGLVKAAHFAPEQHLPIILSPTIEGVNVDAWAANNREFIEAILLSNGGVLFRGFETDSVVKFERLVLALSGEFLKYKERSSPRHNVTDNIYTSTDYRADQEIFLHCENSYQRSWPLKIFFFCMTPAERGGETPIADTRRIYQAIAPEIRERFINKKVMYVRNFSQGVGLTWQTVFQTADKAEVESYCRAADIQCEWLDYDRLRVRQIREAVASHPKTGETVWFNHAAFFHISTLPTAIREGLLSGFEEENLPSNTYYGDGSPIETTTLDAVRGAYYQERILFPWQQGDILMLDNMLSAHGRTPYVGERKIFVAMTEPIASQGIHSAWPHRSA